MESESNIKRYSVEEVQAMRRQGEDRTDWARVDAMTDEQLERLVAEDPDEQDVDWDWDKAVVVMPERKAHMNLRVDADVLRFFKQQGKGYQTRINAVLRAYMLAKQGNDR